MAKNKDPWEKRAEDVAKKAAREVCEEMIQNLRNELNEKAASTQSLPQVQKDDVPPITARQGRKERRLYGKIGTTTDAVLASLFEQEARQRSVSTGRLMDEILWRHYDKPTLSYELPDDEYDRLKIRVEGRKKKEPK